MGELSSTAQLYNGVLMKHNIIRAIPFVVLLLGIAMVLYPTVSEHINALHQSRAIQRYNNIASAMSDSENNAFLNEARDYNEKIAATKDTIPNPGLVPGYYDILDITGTGIMGYVTIDKINVELPIYHGVDDNVLQIASGHLPGSSLPVGGIGTHAVLSGHRGLPSAKLFSDLDKLEVGDVFYITVLSEVMTYQVDQIKTVLPHEIDDLKIVPDKDYCTLFTCTPYGINSHRLLVRGTRIETAEEFKIYVANEVVTISPIIIASIIAVPILIILFIIMMISGRKPKKPAILAEKTNSAE